MSLRHSWREDKIRTLVEKAISGTEDFIAFDFLDDAKKFRFACYGLRHRKKIWTNLSFILDKEAMTVTVKQRPTFEITEDPYLSFRRVKHTESC